jgi:hypothetical protein
MSGSVPVLVFNSLLLILDHGVLGLDVIDLIIEDDKFMLLVLQFVELLLEHGDQGISLHGICLLDGGCSSSVHII